MFEEGKFRSSVRNSHGREKFDFRCRAMPIINYNTDAYSTMFARIELRCLKIRNLKLKKVLQRHQFRNFDGGTVTENQGHEEFVLVSCSFKAYCKLHRLAFT